MTAQITPTPNTEASPLLEPLLGVHSAPSLTWLADATANAAQRGLGVLYTLLYVSDASGRLSPVAPASGPQRSVLARLSQTLHVDLTGDAKVDPELKPRWAEAIESGRAVAVPGLVDALSQPIDSEHAEAAEIQLGVSATIVVPLEWDGERYGIALLFCGAGQAQQKALAEMLARHVAVAIANLREREAGRKHGELDAVRWVYDERRFKEELEQEARRAHRHERPLSVLLVRVLNLDDLRARYGRFLSERVLRQVAGRLDDAMRDTDFLGASGADGFGAILVEADSQGAGIAERRLLEGLRGLNLPDSVLVDLEIKLGCSVATLPQDGETPEELIDVAVKRMARYTIVPEVPPQEKAASA